MLPRPLRACRTGLLGILGAALVGLLCVLAPSANAQPFEPPACITDAYTDVPSSHPFCSEIMMMSGILNYHGYPDGSFHPAAPLTRGDFVSLLDEAVPNGPPCPLPPFSDIARDHPTCGTIWLLSSVGIVTGYGDGTFRPEANMSRQAAAVMATRFVNLMIPGRVHLENCQGDVFSDVGPANPFCAEIEWLASEGVANGYADGGFHPAAPMSRQAFAAFFVRMTFANAGAPI